MAVREERKRHRLAGKACNGDVACQMEEDLLHDSILAEIEANRLACRINCEHSQGTGTGGPAEIDVLGGGLSVADGDTPPRARDDTDFGALNISGGGILHTFTIANPGGSALNLTGTPRVQVVGSGDFTVVTQPAAAVAAGASHSIFL